MDFEICIQNVRKLQHTLSGTDKDVMLTYKVMEAGITKLWNIRVGNHEVNHETHDGALLQLTDNLKRELADKIKKTEFEAKRLSQVLHSMDN